MHAALCQPTLDVASSPSLYGGRKISTVELALLWTLVDEDPECTSRELLDKVAQHQTTLALSLRQVNRWRVKWQRQRRRGRPRGRAAPASGQGVVVKVTPRLKGVGVHLFAHWLDHHHAFDPVVAQLQQATAAYKRCHPEADFALLHHREATLRRRFEALLFAPLFGIERLSAFDTQEHPLPTLLGRGYHSSTLSQFLGQLERVGAAEALKSVLVPAQPGGLAYVDGHMIAFYVAAVVKLSCILFSPLSSLGAVSHRAGSSCGFLWHAALPLPMPFYPFGFRNRQYRLTVSYG